MHQVCPKSIQLENPPKFWTHEINKGVMKLLIRVLLMLHSFFSDVRSVTWTETNVPKHNYIELIVCGSRKRNIDLGVIWQI